MEEGVGGPSSRTRGLGAQVSRVLSGFFSPPSGRRHPTNRQRSAHLDFFIMITYKRDLCINKNVPGLLLLILILPVTPAAVTITSPAEGTTAAPAEPTSPDGTRRSAADSSELRTTLAYSDPSQNSPSDGATDPPETTMDAEYSTTFTSPEETSGPSADPSTTIKTPDKRNEQDRIFIYDYDNLRNWGLICALILCIIGFLVLMSDRCQGISCQRRQKQRYNVSGV